MIAERCRRGRLQVVVATVLSLIVGVALADHQPAFADSRAPLATTTTQQYLADGGFESGEPQSSWSESSAASVALIDGQDPHTGSWAANLCGYDNCRDQLSQTLTDPGQVTSAILTYSYNAATRKADGNRSCEDPLQVGMGIGGGLDPSALQWQCQPPATAGQYQQSSVDVTNFMANHSGAQVQVILLASTTDLYSSQFFVDDVSLTVSYLTTPSAPRSLTVSSRGPSSATVTWQAPAFPSGSSSSSYTITPYVGEVAQTGLAVTTSGTATSYTFSNLSNATTYWFAVGAANGSGAGAVANSFSVTPQSAEVPPARAQAVSSPNIQYQLPNSDGVTWQDIDGNNLTLSFTPASNAEALITGNSDLWTRSDGYNQDLGIAVNGTMAAWKESGGHSGTFSPNAAFVQAVMDVTAGATYNVRLQWKTNVPALGATILAGAGSTGSFSPTRLAVQLVPTFGAAPYPNGRSVASDSSAQPHLNGSDGSTWQPIDASTLQFSMTPSSSGVAMLSANADLWTLTRGFNQDLGIAVNGSVVAWKESGGPAGFSPNAAFLQHVISVSAGTPYTVSLMWKTNRNAPGVSIAIGAGSTGNFSPTRLTAIVIPQGSAATPEYATTWSQAHLMGSDGATWNRLGGATSPTIVLTTPNDGATHTYQLGANADLWTANLGYNQDLAICETPGTVAPDPCPAASIIGWKESGGVGATFSPNAAFLQVSLPLPPNATFTFTLSWKANRAAGTGTIVAAAGSTGNFSPTTLSVQQLS